jgi:hypothetical protein
MNQPHDHTDILRYAARHIAARFVTSGRVSIGVLAGDAGGGYDRKLFFEARGAINAGRQ